MCGTFVPRPPVARRRGPQVVSRGPSPLLRLSRGRSGCGQEDLPTSAVARRTVLRSGLAVAGLGALGACSQSSRQVTGPLVFPADPRISEVEAGRHTTGRVRSTVLTAVPADVDLGGPVVTTWTYDGRLPGREIRVGAGDIVDAELVNRLPVETSIHWHGVAFRNAARQRRPAGYPTSR